MFELRALSILLLTTATLAFSAGHAVAEEASAAAEQTNSPWVRILALVVVGGVIWAILKVARQYGQAAERDAAEEAASGRQDA